MPRFYLPLWVEDYLSDTLDLSATEHGVYLLMLMQAWKREATLPSNVETIYRLAKAMTPLEQTAVDTVLARYWQQQPEGYTNKKLSKVYSYSRSRSERLSNAGKNAAAVRWSNRNASGNATALGTYPQVNSTKEGKHAINGADRIAVGNANGNAAGNAILSLKSKPSLGRTELTESPPAREEQREKNPTDDRPADRPTEDLLIFDGKCFEASASIVDRWQSAFPTLHVSTEIEQCGAWLACHPTAIPEPAELEAFLTRWLLRSANSPRKGIAP